MTAVVNLQMSCAHLESVVKALRVIIKKQFLYGENEWGFREPYCTSALFRYWNVKVTVPEQYVT